MLPLILAEMRIYMIIQDGTNFILETENTTYAFRVMETGHLEHLYYGRKITLYDPYPIVEKHAFPPGNTNIYDSQHSTYSLEDVCLEMSSYGKGDIREPFIEVVHGDGSYTSDFLFEKAEVKKGKEEFKTLPGSYDDTGEVEHLLITLRDAEYNLTLQMSYYVYAGCDVITRSARLINDSNEQIKLTRLMSMSLDFNTGGFVFTTFNGAWAREMKKTDTLVRAGKLVNSSYTGTSSNRANPFVMLSRERTTENHGDCYGFNLIYSGNHYEAVEVSGYGKTRIVTGINPQSFSYVLEPGQDFEAPEAVMTFSHEGFNGMSGHIHEFVREHIVRGQWKHKLRPVLLNSWEASYFDINERKLLNLAKAGKDVGIELFVRDDDTQSLGDWQENRKKLPGGVAGLCRKVKALGLDFGIWVEPEMVNVNSHLYEEHPDWVLQIPGKPHSEGRNQRILDMTKAEVQDYVIKSMSTVFASADISYVKWDMNRTFTDYYSTGLAPDRQGEVAHRYIVGLYRCMKELTEAFPHILFEGCAAGGNRFDLGILCYFPQIWASDDTDAVCRAEIQTGYSYGYPMSVVSAHVSACPNHQTLRTTPLETRFNVAAFGICGYECNLCDMKKEELAAIKEQITLYKEWRDVFQTGDFYRGRSFNNVADETSSYGNSPYTGVLSGADDNITEWTCVSKDKNRAVGMIMQKLVAPNTQYEYYRAGGLAPDKLYHFYNRELKYNVKDFGDLVNTVSPVHIKQDSLAHNLIAKFVKMDGETEDCMAYGDTLMYSGVKLKQSFGGTGYNDQVRYFQDFGSRMYFMVCEN
jgi:alpha-galactosidase